MRNQRALTAAWTAAAVLGLASPVAVADDTGNADVPYTSPGRADHPARPDHSGRADDSGRADHSGRDEGHGNGGRADDSGRAEHPGRDEGHGNGGRADDSSRADGSGRADHSGRDEHHGNDGRADENRNPGRADGHGNGGGAEDSGSGGRHDGSAGRGGDARDDDRGPRDIVVTPGVLPAGGRLTVSAVGCPEGGTMSSRAFPATGLDGSGDGASRAGVRLDRDARPGRYDLTVRCDGRTLVRPDAFTVLGGVHGGVGGSRSAGATPSDMAIGAGLVSLSVVGGGAYWLRRRREQRS
ncbi:hypothetical protein AB0950_26555 [Streptomyces sp. NPDC007189]|uniref:hypothetical protein n=1 Tax=Streptomyces sp. NPDC007189 TaxID=3154315 RepID=UPI00345671A3